ncbi:MAG: NYN domain-containing protein [Syntrophales bacterium]|jgi:predicted RNA-binding protein with PIN domain|nr:NYN domain-containing protein [Syntrophales bacterium]MCK9527491.1 NYN domain-containing protein [Syntrophales bacterium]MDX9922547.1 NYN domain-containing protein [Syntrophales bacterium]
MHIIIDGYNLIRQSDFLREAERISLEAGRHLLVTELVKYNRKRRHRVTVVFDGWEEGSFREEHMDEGGVHIVYSRRGERADEVIKRLCRRAGGSELVVVSSDREVAMYAERSGGVSLSSPEFEVRLMDPGDEPPLRDNHHFEGDEEDQRDVSLTTRKKGPARRLSKRKRKTIRAVRKL